MRRVWLLIGMVLGALIVWSFGHKARKEWKKSQRDPREVLHEVIERDKLKLAMEGAIYGFDFSNPDWWDKELDQYKDLPDDYDEDEEDFF